MNKTMKILMIEDNESDTLLTTRSLKRAGFVFDFVRVDTREDFIRGLKEFKPDLILSDHSLPQFNSLEAYAIYKRDNLKIPFILLTGTVSEEFAVKCLHEGIDDYILKDNLTRLPSAIKNALKKKELEIKEVELENERLANSLRLKEQNDALVKANKELDRFVYSASHELRAPLASVLGLITLSNFQLSERKHEELRECLQMMERSINKLNNTVIEIIYYSINNRSEIANTNIDPNVLVAKALERISHIKDIDIVEKNIQVEQFYPWYSDYDRLLVILDNLISNAIIYKGERNPFVSLEIKVLLNTIFIEVEDNGIGIGEDSISKIFDMFYKASGLSDGAGLGLYIVKEMLEKLNGKINVYSELGKGTVFKIELPNMTKENSRISL